MARRAARVWWGDTLLDERTLAPDEAAPFEPGLRVELISTEPAPRPARGLSAWRDLALAVALVLCSLAALFTTVMPFGSLNESQRGFVVGPRVRVGAAGTRTATPDARESLLRELRRATDPTPVEAILSGRRKWSSPPPTARAPMSGDTAGISGIGTSARDGSVGPYGRRAPTISTSEPVLDGPLSPEIIRRIVRSHRRELVACYDFAIAHGQPLGAGSPMHFTIGPNGSVIDAGPRAAEIDRCLARTISTWKFPPPNGGGSVIVNYPFNFGVRTREM